MLEMHAKTHLEFSCKVLIRGCPVLTKLQMWGLVLLKLLHVKFHERLFAGFRVV